MMMMTMTMMMTMMRVKVKVKLKLKYKAQHPSQSCHPPPRLMHRCPQPLSLGNNNHMDKTIRQQINLFRRATLHKKGRGKGVGLELVS